MEEKMQIEELIGKDLEGFTIREVTEVYPIDEDGHSGPAVGFCLNVDTAALLADIKRAEGNRCTYEMRNRLILTDGAMAFLVGNTAVELLHKEQLERTIRELALAKLTARERKLLNL